MRSYVNFSKELVFLKSLFLGNRGIGIFKIYLESKFPQNHK